MVLPKLYPPVAVISPFVTVMFVKSPPIIVPFFELQTPPPPIPAPVPTVAPYPVEAYSEYPPVAVMVPDVDISPSVKHPPFVVVAYELNIPPPPSPAPVPRQSKLHYRRHPQSQRILC